MTEEVEGQMSIFDLDGWSGKTSAERSAVTKEQTSKPCSRKSSKSQSQKPLMCLCLKKVNGPMPGSYMMRWETGALLGGHTMLNTGESPNAEKEYLWSLTSQVGGAAEVLFEQCTGNESRHEIQPVSESLPRDSEPSGTQRQETAGTVGESTPSTGGGAISFRLGRMPETISKRLRAMAYHLMIAML